MPDVPAERRAWAIRPFTRRDAQHYARSAVEAWVSRDLAPLIALARLSGCANIEEKGRSAMCRAERARIGGTVRGKPRLRNRKRKRSFSVLRQIGGLVRKAHAAEWRAGYLRGRSSWLAAQDEEHLSTATLLSRRYPFEANCSSWM